MRKLCRSDRALLINHTRSGNCCTVRRSETLFLRRVEELPSGKGSHMKTVFVSGDQTLTIVAAQGKTGFNVKASVKNGKGKGTPKAITGARAKFTNAVEAEKAVKKLTEEAVSQGWAVKPVTSRNAFTSIPAPTGKGLAKTKK